jgi:hypothetical protein
MVNALNSNYTQVLLPGENSYETISSVVVRDGDLLRRLPFVCSAIKI